MRPREDLTRRDFDVAIVTELGAFRDPAAVLSEVRRMVGQRGVTIVMARNPESAVAEGPETPSSFDYYALFDAVAAEFDYVRMVAQLPCSAASRSSSWATATSTKAAIPAPA